MFNFLESAGEQKKKNRFYVLKTPYVKHLIIWRKKSLFSKSKDRDFKVFQ